MTEPSYYCVQCKTIVRNGDEYIPNTPYLCSDTCKKEYRDSPGEAINRKVSIPKHDKDTFPDILKKMADVYTAKQADYSGAFADPYANFKACETLGIPAWKGVLVRLMDKFNRLQSLARPDVAPKNEPIEDTMLDIANYAVIMLELYTQYKSKEMK